MAGHGFGRDPATHTSGFRQEDTQFTGADASQLDPTAHGADYGFLDFTQQEPAADDLGSAYHFSSFSQVRWLPACSLQAPCKLLEADRSEHMHIPRSMKCLMSRLMHTALLLHRMWRTGVTAHRRQRQW
jgi:hypothetical protein